MKFIVGSVLNTSPAQPGWKVVVKDDRDRFVQDVVAWATVVRSIEEDGSDTDVEPVFIVEECVVAAGVALRGWGISVEQILPPGIPPGGESGIPVEDGKKKGKNKNRRRAGMGEG
jgi:hypothetical protein